MADEGGGGVPEALRAPAAPPRIECLALAGPPPLQDGAGGITIDTRDKALAAAQAAQEKKAHNAVILDVHEHCSYADHLLIVSGSSERQTAAIAEAVVEHLREHHRLSPLARERSGGWVLVDYGDLVVHVFLDEARGFYDLERLWSQAPRVAVPALEPLPEPVERAGAVARRR